MDWPAIIDKLAKAGWTQTQIAERCGCAQSTISDLANDRIKAPAYSIGRELERLCAGLKAPKTRKAA